MEHHDPGPDTADRPVAAVRAILNGWDPIGVMDLEWPADEYDCLIAPLLGRLAAGAGAPELVAFLTAELADHFGLDPGHHAAGIAEVARATVALRAGG